MSINAATDTIRLDALMQRYTTPADQDHRDDWQARVLATFRGRRPRFALPQAALLDGGLGRQILGRLDIRPIREYADKALTPPVFRTPPDWFERDRVRLADTAEVLTPFVTRGLARDQSVRVRRAMARRADLPPSVRRELATDCDVSVARDAIAFDDDGLEV